MSSSPPLTDINKVKYPAQIVFYLVLLAIGRAAKPLLTVFAGPTYAPAAALLRIEDLSPFLPVRTALSADTICDE